MEIEETVENAVAMQEEETTPEHKPNAVPCTIHMLNGKQFIVNDIMAWGYTPTGVHANGHFKGYTGEINIIVRLDRIDYIELHWDALQRYMDRAAEDAANFEAGNQEAA